MDLRLMIPVVLTKARRGHLLSVLLAVVVGRNQEDDLLDKETGILPVKDRKMRRKACQTRGPFNRRSKVEMNPVPTEEAILIRTEREISIARVLDWTNTIIVERQSSQDMEDRTTRISVLDLVLRSPTIHHLITLEEITLDKVEHKTGTREEISYPAKKKTTGVMEAMEIPFIRMIGINTLIRSEVVVTRRRHDGKIATMVSLKSPQQH
mmetsp:Transcript_42516/g.165952  ORF Transcript_42516/g.165952 Transcript_42516/m.165952 type:complete len:209 (-) Transcript_42516:1980-2606(-)